MNFRPRNRFRRAASRPQAPRPPTKPNEETILQRKILASLGFMPEVVVLNIPPGVFGEAAERFYLAAIERFERKEGAAIWVERVNTGAMRSESNDKRRIRANKPGTLDLGIVVKPWGVGGQWEVKTPDGGDLRPSQRINLRWLKATGQLHGELRSVEDGRAAVHEALGMCRARFGDLNV